MRRAHLTFPTLLLGLGLGLAGQALPATAAEPIASSSSETPGMRLLIKELRRDTAGTVMLRFAIVNDTRERFVFTGAHNVYLIDLAGRRKYEVVRDTGPGRQCVCTPGNRGLGPGEGADFWARFPAPPAGVTRLGVVAPSFLPVENVRVSE
jgi:hypothetical protein